MQKDLILNYQQRLALERSEKALTKERELAQQRSSLIPPEGRIRQWEKVHALQLPRDPAHPILDVIAAATGLTVREVRVQQYQRFASDPRDLNQRQTPIGA